MPYYSVSEIRKRLAAGIIQPHELSGYIPSMIEEMATSEENKRIENAYEIALFTLSSGELEARVREIVAEIEQLNALVRVRTAKHPVSSREEAEREILAVLDLLQQRNAPMQLDFHHELLAVGELAIALETLCDNMFEAGVSLPADVLSRIECVGRFLNADPNYRRDLRPDPID